MFPQEKVGLHIRALVQQFGSQRSALIPILQELQRTYRHLSDTAMQLVAAELQLSPAEVHSVASFYSFFNTAPRGRFTIRLCRTISCDMANKDALARQLCNDLGIQFGETTPDKCFTLEWTSCMGLCDQGPAMMVNEQLHTRVTPQQVHDILQECRSTFPMNHYVQEHSA